MNLVSFSLVLTGVLLNAAAQLLLKAGVKDVGVIQLTPATIFNAGLKLALEPHILGGLTCYVISVVVWILALSRVQVSIAYPMLSLGYVVTAVIAWGFMGETVNAMRMSGIAVIIVGVFLVARS
jgi:multidrug transporter EmrE-like cation transporter